MESLQAGNLRPGMVLKDSFDHVYLVVSKPGGKHKLLMLGGDDEGPLLLDLSQVEQWQDLELSKDKLDWDHLRSAILGWEFIPTFDSSLTLEQINKIFGTDGSLEDLLKSKRKKKAA